MVCLFNNNISNCCSAYCVYTFMLSGDLLLVLKGTWSTRERIARWSVCAACADSFYFNINLFYSSHRLQWEGKREYRVARWLNDKEMSGQGKWQTTATQMRRMRFICCMRIDFALINEQANEKRLTTCTTMQLIIKIPYNCCRMIECAANTAQITAKLICM